MLMNCGCPSGDRMRQHLSGIQGPPGPPGASVSVEEVAARVIAYIQRKSRTSQHSHMTLQKNIFKAFMVCVFYSLFSISKKYPRVEKACFGLIFFVVVFNCNVLYIY